MEAVRRERDVLAARAPGGSGPGIALSLLAHLALFAALMWGVRWSNPATEAVSAELWASVPRVAAPPAVAPPPAAATPAPPPAPRPTPAPPPTPKADIAIEQARKAAEKQRAEQQAKAEKTRLETERQDKTRREKDERDRQEKAARDKEARAKAEADKRTAAQAEQRVAQQREEQLARMMGQLGGAGSPGTKGTSSTSAGPSASYAGRIVAAIKPNIVFSDTPTGNPAAEVEVRAGPSGSIIGRTLVKSSGNAEWDEAVLRAIDRTASLPRDVDGRVPPRLTITFRPRD